MERNWVIDFAANLAGREKRLERIATATRDPQGELIPNALAREIHREQNLRRGFHAWSVLRDTRLPFERRMVEIRIPRARTIILRQVR